MSVPLCGSFYHAGLASHTASLPVPPPVPVQSLISRPVILYPRITWLLPLPGGGSHRSAV